MKDFLSLIEMKFLSFHLFIFIEKINYYRKIKIQEAKRILRFTIPHIYQ